MNRASKVLLTLILLSGMTIPAFASDWDVAGKVLTGIEGLRVLSGGEIDVIGTITGINTRKYSRHDYGNDYRYHRAKVRDYCEREWVPDYAWKEKWVPAHKEYNHYTGRTIFVEGHYVRYKIETGGHWVYQCSNRSYHHHRGH